MALTPASVLADYSSGIGTQGATLQIKTNEQRIGIGTTCLLYTSDAADEP